MSKKSNGSALGFALIGGLLIALGLSSRSATVEQDPTEYEFLPDEEN